MCIPPALTGTCWLLLIGTLGHIILLPCHQSQHLSLWVMLHLNPGCRTQSGGDMRYDKMSSFKEGVGLWGWGFCNQVFCIQLGQLSKQRINHVVIHSL